MDDGPAARRGARQGVPVLNVALDDIGGVAQATPRLVRVAAEDADGVTALDQRQGHGAPEGAGGAEYEDGSRRHGFSPAAPVVHRPPHDGA